MRLFWIGIGVFLIVIVIIFIVKYNNKNNSSINSETDYEDNDLPDEIIIEGQNDSDVSILHYKKENGKFISRYTKPSGTIMEEIDEETYRRGYKKYLRYKEDPITFYKSLI